MIVKDKFNLIQGTDNILNMSPTALKRVTVANGPRKIFVQLEMMKSRINHFTKNKIIKLVSNKKQREIIKVVNLPNYLFPVSYNKPTKSIIINLHPFGVDDILTQKPGVENLYACLVYGIMFYELASGKAKVIDRYGVAISNYLVSVLLRLFGKDYGLLGSFSREIVKLKFLTNCYVFASFFDIKPPSLYKKASGAAAFNYKDIEDSLKKYNFADINDFIKSLNELGVMPNLNRHTFAAKVIKKYQVSFIPAFEDLARFFSVLTTSEISGQKVVATWLDKPNRKEFNNILEFSKGLFKRG
jgi:hypothetical protein